MKVFEKKCPNCNANLEFKVGEKDVKCPSCRREFAVEYDHSIVDPEIELKAKDITLKILDDFEQQRKLGKVIRAFCIIMFVVIFGFAVVMIIRGVIEQEQMRDEAQKRQEQSQQQQEKQDEVQKQIEERVLEMMDQQIEQQKSAGN